MCLPFLMENQVLIFSNITEHRGKRVGQFLTPGRSIVDDFVFDKNLASTKQIE